MPAWRMLFGLAFLVAGAYLLGQHVARDTDLVAFLSTWWPIAVIALGLVNLARLVDRPWVWALLGPLLLVGAGGVLQLYRLHRLNPEASLLLLQPALILVGLLLVLPGIRWQHGSPSVDKTFRRRVVLRGERIVRLPGPLVEGAITVLLGAVKLDLRAATFQHTNLNVLTIFGTVHMFVPDVTDVDERRAFVLKSGSLRFTTLPPGGAELTINILGFFGDVLVTRTTLWVPSREATTVPPPNG